MPDLLIELFSEEIPARMQAKAAEDLRLAITNGLVEAGLVYEGAKAFATPRRLALCVMGVPAGSPDTREERKGPRVGAPEQALQGFLKAAGLASIDQAHIQSDGKKGEFYVAMIEKSGRPAAEIISAVLTKTIREFPWPKSMRWGAASAAGASLRWVRPLHGIIALFGAETEEPEIVPVDIDGLRSGNSTRGHRFMAPGAFAVKRFDDYMAGLEKAKVVLDAERRKSIILNDAKDLALAQGLELIEDQGLLDEVSGLVEWPVVLMGAFEPEFLAIPPEVIRATIGANQKCFVLREAASGKLANRFILTSNLEASDGGKQIVAGNEKVVRARLSDARFFWESDQKIRLEDRLEKLKTIVFHEELGTQYERVTRIAALAREIAPLVGADADIAERAARLAKADLVTEMVGEFPELQGLMGCYYATLQGEPPEIAAACEEHYKPQGPSDRVPSSPVPVAVALADKMDTLAGFWAVDEKPTGSKDPYALRRAALGVIRLVLENGVRVRLRDKVRQHLDEFVSPPYPTRREPGATRPSDPQDDVRDKVAADLLAFFHDRLKVQLREQGQRQDLVDAVLAQGADNDDLVLVVERVKALAAFLATDNGKALLAGTKRAANILRIEEKKDGVRYNGVVDPALITAGAPEELALAKALDQGISAAEAAVADENFTGAMAALAALRPEVDAFFDKILVNDPDPAIRKNRLNLLARLRAATLTVADFSKVEG